MKGSVTSQSTGGKNPAAASGKGIKVGVNYQDKLQVWRPSKHAKAKGKSK